MTHYREIQFNKKEIYWTIEDRFEGSGSHSIDLYFHFDTGIDFIIEGNSIRTRCSDANNILMLVNSEETITFQKIESFVSKSYGSKKPSYSLKVSYQGNKLKKIITTIRQNNN